MKMDYYEIRNHFIISGLRSVDETSLKYCINDTDETGATLLHITVIYSDFPSTLKLLMLGYDPCVKNYRGLTPIDEALFDNDKKLALLLKVFKIIHKLSKWIGPRNHTLT